MIYSISNTFLGILLAFSTLPLHLYALPTPKFNIYKIDKVLSSTLTSSDYLNEVGSAINGLQQWYSTETGLWNNLWWNSANVLTMFADLQARFPGAYDISPILAATYANATTTSAGFPGYINDFYDDELWWCLAWIQVYDVTNDEKYLDTASSIFENAKKAWGTQQCGGLRWNKGSDNVNAIENELYLTAAAKLANRKPNVPSPGYYLTEAIKVHDWFVASGMINNQSLINDGLDQNCQNNQAPTYTYNQGVILSGLVELTWSTGDAQYATLANKIAAAAVQDLSDKNGILTDPCDVSGCTGDGGQFKGVFVRNLQFLVERSTVLDAGLKQTFVEWILNNANVLWKYDRDGNLLGPEWSGPYLQADVQTQSSALDALVGAAAVA